MSSDMKNDRVVFDRLVDGELSAGERQSLIASLDDRENGWRQCAFAFLEAQAWRHDIGALVSNSSQASNSIQTSGKKRPQLSGFNSRWLSMHWLAVAAGLLVAFGGGLFFGTSRFQHAPRIPTEQVADNAWPQGAATGEVLTMWVSDEQGRRRSLDVPLVDAGKLDRQWGTQFRSAISDELRRQFESQGYRIQSRQRYAPVWIGKDRPLVLPVEDTQIVPVSRPVW
jgi:hypothetical protein